MYEEYDDLIADDIHEAIGDLNAIAEDELFDGFSFKNIPLHLHRGGSQGQSIPALGADWGSLSSGNRGRKYVSRFRGGASYAETLAAERAENAVLYARLGVTKITGGYDPNDPWREAAGGGLKIPHS